ncbi:MAG TPA: DUF2270 domain-containing protein [Candidatus Polarisedimenticolia bacterium]|nr:DUF2270 domain-containing protein [Candidatus Polarisedimenticolia bacterium]
MEQKSPAAGPAPKKAPSFEEYPLTRQEYINALVHLYRGEMHRSLVWRTRLDTTSNWAVITTAAMISFAFSEVAHPGIILLLANLLITTFLFQEAHRYRHFSVYRARVRMLEENFFLPILTRELVSPIADWRRSVASDLDRPKFKTTLVQAIGFRLERNYLWIFLILMVAFVVKLFIHPFPAVSLGEAYARMRVGPVPPWIILTFALTFYGLLFASLIAVRRRGMPVDEIAGLEEDLGHWKL